MGDEVGFESARKLLLNENDETIQQDVICYAFLSAFFLLSFCLINSLRYAERNAQ